MAFTEKQIRAVLKMFVNTFAACGEDKRIEVYEEFTDSFLCVIQKWDEKIYAAFMNEGISSEVINHWRELERDRKKGYFTEQYEICKMTMEDEQQIVKLITREIGSTPRYAEFDEVGTVKDFQATDYSFVAKKNNEVIGLIMAQKIMDYGSYHIFVNNFAVESSMQGRGIGRQLMERLITTAKKERIHKIMLHTEKSRKAYDIYHHMGFEDQSNESVYMTKWFL